MVYRGLPYQNAVSNTRWFRVLVQRSQTSETVPYDVAPMESCIRPRANGLYSSSSPHHLFLQKLTKKCSYGLQCPVFPKYPSIQPMIASTRPVASKHCRYLPWSSVRGSLYKTSSFVRICSSLLHHITFFIITGAGRHGLMRLVFSE